MNHFQFETEFISQLEGVERKKYVQQIKIVKYLYMNGSQTTSLLCKKLKISAPNMMAILSELVDKKIIEKSGQGKSIGGRKPDLFRLVSDSFCVMAVELSIYKISISIFNAKIRR